MNQVQQLQDRPLKSIWPQQTSQQLIRKIEVAQEFFPFWRRIVPLDYNKHQVLARRYRRRHLRKCLCLNDMLQQRWCLVAFGGRQEISSALFNIAIWCLSSLCWVIYFWHLVGLWCCARRPTWTCTGASHCGRPCRLGLHIRLGLAWFSFWRYPKHWALWAAVLAFSILLLPPHSC